MGAHDGMVYMEMDYLYRSFNKTTRRGMIWDVDSD